MTILSHPIFKEKVYIVVNENVDTFFIYVTDVSEDQCSVFVQKAEIMEDKTKIETMTECLGEGNPLQKYLQVSLPSIGQTFSDKSLRDPNILKMIMFKLSQIPINAESTELLKSKLGLDSASFNATISTDNLNIDGYPIEIIQSVFEAYSGSPKPELGSAVPPPVFLGSWDSPAPPKPKQMSLSELEKLSEVAKDTRNISTNSRQEKRSMAKRHNQSGCNNSI